MITETTWHPNENKQTQFLWKATEEGIQLDHDTNQQGYTIPWSVFHAVYVGAQTLLDSNKRVFAGTSRTAPPAGSVGEWVNMCRFDINPGRLTSGHISFLGPIYGRMGLITRQINGRAIVWRFNIGQSQTEEEMI